MPTSPATDPARLFTPEEINAVLGHYELGIVSSVRELFAGGAGSPKAMIECARGKFVLKRRAPGRSNPFRVAYAHEVMLRLRARGFAAPTLVGTRDGNNSMLQFEGRVYELFAFIEGRGFDRSVAQARAAGSSLARLHAVLEGFRPRHPDPAPRGELIALIRRAADAVHAEAHGRELETLADRARAGDPGPEGLAHGDWHPGNLLFRGDLVAGVFDFDSVRRGPRADDVAQGLVQFSMTRAGTSPDDWPPEPDVNLATAFLAGYSNDGERTVLTPDDAPGRMVRALAAEWAEGAVSGVLGGPEQANKLLGAVVRKSEWLTEHADELTRALTPPS